MNVSDSRPQAASIKATNAADKIVLIMRISSARCPLRAVTGIDIELIKRSEKWRANFGIDGFEPAALSASSA